jgi:hypothetical protein
MPWQQSRSGQYGGGGGYPPPDGPRDEGFRDPGYPAQDGGGYAAQDGGGYSGQGGGYPAQGGDGAGYGDPYGPPPDQGAGGYDERNNGGPRQNNQYEKNEIIAAGHGFFGAVSQSLAGAVEYAFKSQGRPNGYILGEDAGGAFVVGLRYGEGMLYTKDAGDHKVFWQGPSVGYDAGADGSKTMVLVYNMREPSEIYNRFGGAQGAAYLVGGVSVQFQKYGDVTLGVIRAGVGLRLGANVGYLKYTRAATWNPL